MAILTLNQYDSYISSNNNRVSVFKIVFLRKSDETPLLTLDGDLLDMEGSVTNTLNEGVRRSCSFTLQNFDNQYSSFFTNLGIGNKFKLYVGYLIDDVPLYFSYGVYVMSAPALVSDRAQKVVQISGDDKWSMLNGVNGGILQSTYVAPLGTTLLELVNSLLKLEIVNDPIQPVIWGGERNAKTSYYTYDTLANFELSYDIVKDAGAYVADIILDAIYSASAYCYYNEDGRLTVKPYDFDGVKAPVYEFISGQEINIDNDLNYISTTRTYDFANLYNAVVVLADNVQNADVPIVAQYYNTDPTDPNSVLQLGYYKYKIITEYTKGINTQQLANDRAAYELKIAAAKQSTLTLSCLPLYHLDVNSVILITDPFINADGEKFLINSITTPLSTKSAMSLEVVKTRGYL